MRKAMRLSRKCLVLPTIELGLAQISQRSRLGEGCLEPLIFALLLLMGCREIGVGSL
jgi:hypothetical protein